VKFVETKTSIDLLELQLVELVSCSLSKSIVIVI